MARDVVDTAAIETRDDLVTWIEKGCKERSAFRLGTEHEKVPFYRADTFLCRMSASRRGGAAFAMSSRACRRASSGSQFPTARRSLDLPLRMRARRFRWSPADNSSFPARRSKACMKLRKNSTPTCRRCAPSPTARHRFSKSRHATEMAAFGHSGHAEAALRDHGGLHAESRYARPRHDVPYRDSSGQSRLPIRSRHGEETARRVGVAADRHGDVRQLPIHRGKTERLFVDRVRKSGATPMVRAPACWHLPSRTAWDSSATSITRSMCRCISSSAASVITT